MINLDKPIRVKGGKPARYVTKYINYLGKTKYVVVTEVGGTFAGNNLENCNCYAQADLERLFENDPVVTSSFRNVYAQRKTDIHSFGASCPTLEEANLLYERTKGVNVERIGLFKTTYHDGNAVEREFLP